MILTFLSYLTKMAMWGLFKYVNIINTLEDKLVRKVDLVVDGTLLPFARESAERDKIPIYERAS